MNKKFRLYQSIKSSYFDLISGDKETQQTKGLGLLLSKSEEALISFLNIKNIHSKLKKYDLNSVDELIVNCELVSRSENKYRADIVLRFYKSNKPYFALLIEAKSINKGVSVYQTNKQIENYIEGNVFEELIEFKSDTYGVTLTKLPSIISHEYLISITWSDIIKCFYKKKSKKDSLLEDYFIFLTNIKGTMKFYEREVFSIPTVKWSSTAIDKFNVYECPNSGRYLIKQKPLFLTFRKSGGGEMEKLYKVENIIILNFSSDLNTFLKDENYDEDSRNKVKNYAEYMIEKGIWNKLPEDEKQVFLLSDNTIELKNKPKPKRNNSFRAYYDLSSLLNNKIVESKNAKD